MTRGSRISRWTGAEIPRRIAEAPLLHANRGDVGLADRADAALKVALAALTAARAELAWSHRQNRVIAAFELAVGAFGLIGVATTGFIGALGDQPVLSCLFILAAAVPLGMSLHRMGSGRVRESEIVAAVENARAVALNAASLREAASGLSATEGAHSGAKTLMEALLTTIEQSAAAAPGRERRSRGVLGEEARRHIRIKPLNDRIVVTRSDGVAIITQIVDVSRSGVALSGALPDVAVGDQILVGSRAARVVRALPHGIACEFLKTLPPAQLDFDIVL